MQNQFKTIKQSGDWSLREFTVTEKDEELEKLRSIFGSGRYVPAGTYQQLFRNGTVVMSNTPDELRDFRTFIIECENLARQRGKINILIGGLGMGCVVDALLQSDYILNITVIEKSEDVIKITSPKYKNNQNVTIMQGDIFAVENKKLPIPYYDIAWFDIWDNICGDNVEEFKKLNRKYGNKVFCKMFWVEQECRRLNRKNSLQEV